MYIHYIAYYYLYIKMINKMFYFGAYKIEINRVAFNYVDTVMLLILH